MHKLVPVRSGQHALRRGHGIWNFNGDGRDVADAVSWPSPALFARGAKRRHAESTNMTVGSDDLAARAAGQIRAQTFSLAQSRAHMPARVVIPWSRLDLCWSPRWFSRLPFFLGGGANPSSARRKGEGPPNAPSRSERRALFVAVISVIGSHKGDCICGELMRVLFALLGHLNDVLSDDLTHAAGIAGTSKAAAGFL